VPETAFTHPAGSAGCRPPVFWADRLTEGVMASRLAQIPMGRPGTPAEVAAAVAHLAAPDAGWTGQILQVNGGTLAGRG
jgi:3-oxoacyl-[acyl-carrier protein] reductase